MSSCVVLEKDGCLSDQTKWFFFPQMRMNVMKNTVVVFTADSRTTRYKIHAINNTFVSENTCLDVTCRRFCSNCFSGWVPMLPLLWCTFWVLREMMHPAVVTCNHVVQKILAFHAKTLIQSNADFNSSASIKSANRSWFPAIASFRKCRCSWIHVVTVNIERFPSCVMSGQVMCRLSRIRQRFTTITPGTQGLLGKEEWLLWAGSNRDWDRHIVQSSLKGIHHSNVILRLSVSKTCCAWSLR